MPIPDALISKPQMVVLQQACQYSEKFYRLTETTVGYLANLPESTVLEILRTIHGRYPYYSCAELFVFADGNYYVVGWRKKAPLAISSGLGMVVENQPFQLAPSIVATARARIDPQTQWKANRGERKGFSIAGCVFIMLAILAYAFGIEPRGAGTATFFSVLALIMLAFPFVLGPWFNRNARIRTHRALHEICAV